MDLFPEIDKAERLFEAGTSLFRMLCDGRAVDTGLLRTAMASAFGKTDAAGAWTWKDAYEAC